MIFTSGTTGGDNFDDADIVAYSTDSGKLTTIFHGGFYARYVSNGYLVYLHNGTLFAVPFDAKRLELTGQAAPLLEGVSTDT